MSRQRAKGTRFETAIARWLCVRTNSDGSTIYRKALSGARDAGDIHIEAHGMVGIIEAKDHKQVAPALVERWQDQTIAERNNAHAEFGLLVIHTTGCGATEKSPTFGRNIVRMTLRDLSRISSAVIRIDGHEDSLWVQMTLDDLLTLLED